MYKTISREVILMRCSSSLCRFDDSVNWRNFSYRHNWQAHTHTHTHTRDTNSTTVEGMNENGEKETFIRVAGTANERFSFYFTFSKSLNLYALRARHLLKTFLHFCVCVTDWVWLYGCVCVGVCGICVMLYKISMPIDQFRWLNSHTDPMNTSMFSGWIWRIS